MQTLGALLVAHLLALLLGDLDGPELRQVVLLRVVCAKDFLP